MPCKHMLSIMNVGFTWDLFSIKYHQSPFYNLDSSVINNNVGDVLRGDSDNSDDGFHDDDDECEEIFEHCKKRLVSELLTLLLAEMSCSK